jgi:phage baseplate assembly protein W
MSEQDALIGAGWSFPLGVDGTGGIALSRRDRELAEAMYLILGTAPGERPMRPEFGCGIHNYVFAPGDANTAASIGHEVRTSLHRWEPRITVDDVIVTLDPVTRATFYIDIRYTPRDSTDPRSLVFPFYVIPQRD